MLSMKLKTAALAAVVLLAGACAENSHRPMLPSGSEEDIHIPANSAPVSELQAVNLPNSFTRAVVPPKGKVTCEKASAHLPLARSGGVQTPSQLASLVEQSLGLDASGNGYISGTNMTPNMYVMSVNEAKIRVTGASALPMYLRSLTVMEAPKDVVFKMTRVIYVRDALCFETFKLDTKVGFARKAHADEKVWVDPNDNSIVQLSGCTNSPMSVHLIPGVAASPVSVSLIQTSGPDLSAERCLWVRVHPDQRQSLELRSGSVRGLVLRRWDNSDLSWENGRKSGYYAEVCFTEADMQYAESRGEDLVICNKKSSVILRRTRDFPTYRANPKFPKTDPAKLGKSWS